MNQEMIAALRELEREKGIAFETILEGLEEAMASAYKSWWKQQHPELDEETFGVRAKIDPESGDLRVWVQELERIEHEDEEGEITVETKVLSEQEVQVTDEFKGRIGAQTAKQVIFQRLRDAEREMTYEEFAGREGDVVTGIVQQSERRYTLLDLGKVEALLPQAEQVPSEPYRNGERLKGYITEVRKEQGAADRRVADPPRVAQEAVRARGARDRRGDRRDQGGGSRARPPFEDRGLVQRARGRPGRCVRGPKGSRVRNVVTELRGEKIDVVPWSADPATFVANALQPAKVRGSRRPRDPDRARDRSRLPALARDRPRGAERAARGPAHRLADRHQERDAVRRRTARRASACAARAAGGCGGAFAVFDPARLGGSGPLRPGMRPTVATGRAPTPPQPPGRLGRHRGRARRNPRDDSAPHRTGPSAMRVRVSRSSSRMPSRVCGGGGGGEGGGVVVPTAHVPARTCVGCRERGDKRDLVRFVAVAGGSVRMDLRGSNRGEARTCIIGARASRRHCRTARSPERSGPVWTSTEPLPLGRISRGNWIIEGS